ncbi:NBR1-Ig-like domain-containing protein [Microtetraspora fusca]|uniref:NBR1-Ig-like domain-containing protein n=1 Tax=Microtetraspora fusca TaxID=1997 RepID=A0ABW6VAR8_MICFU
MDDTDVNAPRRNRRTKRRIKVDKVTAAIVTIVTALIGGIATVVAAIVARDGDPAPEPSPANAPVASGYPLLGDSSDILRDVTYPDGAQVPRGQQLDKKWELRNSGNVAWSGRFLAPANSALDEGPCYPRNKRYEIPYTAPQQKVVISAEAVTEPRPGHCHLTWKMIDEAGHFFFPNGKGVELDVTVG